MNKNTKYLKQLKAVTKIAREAGLDYIRSYAYKGPKVTRLKFWAVSSSRKIKKAFASQAILLPYVSHVKHQPSLPPSARNCYSTPEYIKVYFKC